LAEHVLQPPILIFEGREHQVFLALEMLVESGLADADIRENLVDPDVAEAIAIKPASGRFDQFLPCCRGHEPTSK
jgi:hypothetical protein